jgi:3-hydroxyisobutyrate dehydrogenase-like beta-hydroxyacid dehydrogenase
VSAAACAVELPPARSLTGQTMACPQLAAGVTVATAKDTSNRYKPVHDAQKACRAVYGQEVMQQQTCVVTCVHYSNAGYGIRVV